MTSAGDRNESGIWGGTLTKWLLAVEKFRKLKQLENYFAIKAKTKVNTYEKIGIVPNRVQPVVKKLLIFQGERAQQRHF